MMKEVVFNGEQHIMDAISVLHSENTLIISLLTGNEDVVEIFDDLMCKALHGGKNDKV